MGLLSLAEDVLAAGSGPERLRVRARRRAECTNERQAAEQARPRRGRPPEGKHAHAVPSLTCVLDRTSLRSELTPCHQAQPCAVCGVARAPYASAGVDLTLSRPCCGCGRAAGSLPAAEGGGAGQAPVRGCANAGPLWPSSSARAGSCARARACRVGPCRTAAAAPRRACAAHLPGRQRRGRRARPCR